jgi:hypothetical protein
VLAGLRDGSLDPDDRRWYTLKQYVFLREAEKAHRELSIDGALLSPSAPLPTSPRPRGEGRDTRHGL